MENEIIKIDSLCKHYNAFRIQNLSFALKEGSITGIIGENGAGKSTILKMIAGIIEYESGEIFFDGKKRRNGECHLEIGYMSDGQDIYPDISIGEISKYVRNAYGSRWNQKKYEYYLNDIFGIDEQKKMKELSTGTRVKYFLALELAKQPKLFLLDEPTSGLDPMMREEVIQILDKMSKEENVTIFFSSHITEDIEKIGERIIYLENGSILLDNDKNNIRSQYIKTLKSSIANVDRGQYDEIVKEAVELRDYYLFKKNQVKLPDTIQTESAMLSEVLYFLKEKENVSSNIKRF